MLPLAFNACRFVAPEAAEECRRAPAKPGLPACVTAAGRLEARRRCRDRAGCAAAAGRSCSGRAGRRADGGSARTPVFGWLFVDETEMQPRMFGGGATLAFAAEPRLFPRAPWRAATAMPASTAGPSLSLR